MLQHDCKSSISYTVKFNLAPLLPYSWDLPILECGVENLSGWYLPRPAHVKMRFALALLASGGAQIAYD
jgi:hypothetical protein